jgi:CheY-like chemotaxis protein
MLAVSDTGCGMDRETLSQLFEPFFTTKGEGEGTGLGLATVYGVVKQNDGFINVYSEPGEGTTFKIYLPLHEAGIEERKERKVARIPEGGRETILLVEDESMILSLGQKMMEHLGYRVLAANKPSEALRLAEAHADTIDLLITDVVMPEMTGRELADRLRSVQPDLKVLYMSGYTANVIAHHGVLEEGISFLQKPFSVQDLANMIREAIGTPA